MGKSGSGFTAFDETDFIGQVEEARSQGTFFVRRGEDTAMGIKPDFRPFVERGARWLDEVDPGWFTEIKTDALDLDDENMCVLGQSWSHYARAQGLIDAEKGRVATGASTNFKAFLTRVFGSYADNGEDKAREMGFAFPKVMYRWVHLEAARRVGKTKGTAFNDMTWTIDKELWEELTKTWLEVIREKQTLAALSKDVITTPDATTKESV